MATVSLVFIQTRIGIEIEIHEEKREKKSEQHPNIV